MTHATVHSYGYPTIPIPESVARKPLRDARDVLEATEMFSNMSVEYGILITLDDNDIPIAMHMASVGGETQTTYCIGELIRTAILDRASGVILVHNHPNACVKPSKADVEFASEVEKQFDAANITVIDSVIISGNMCHSMLSYDPPDSDGQFGNAVEITSRIFIDVGNTTKNLGLIPVVIFTIETYTYMSRGLPLPLMNAGMVTVLMLPVFGIALNGVGKVMRCLTP